MTTPIFLSRFKFLSDTYNIGIFILPVFRFVIMSVVLGIINEQLCLFIQFHCGNSGFHRLRETENNFRNVC